MPYGATVTPRRLGLSALLATLLLLPPSVTAPAGAQGSDDAPVVVDDAVTMWPGGAATVDVLANDSDPAGDDLAVCRLPVADLTSPRQPPVRVVDASTWGGPAGQLVVLTSLRAHGTYVVDYYVCNHTRLTPARLTITVQPTEPVDVVPDRRAGRVRITNHNDRTIEFVAVAPRSCEIDAERRVGAGATVSAKVHHRSIEWLAVIHDRTSFGIVAHGKVQGIRLGHRPRHHGSPHHGDCSSVLPAMWPKAASTVGLLPARYTRLAALARR